MTNNNFDKMTPAQFTHEMFGTVRVLKGEEGEVWFVARDVAESLGYKYPANAVSEHCKRKEILKMGDSPTLNVPNRGLTIIPEPDVYRLIMRSKLPSAEQFEAWVMEEVLPSIRKHGAYINKQMADPSWLREMADVIEQKNLEIAEKNAALAEAKPKVVCTDNLTDNMQRFKPTHLAGMLEIPYSIFRDIAMKEGIIMYDLPGYDYGWRYIPTKTAYDYDFTPAGAKHMTEALREHGYKVPEVV